jgi:hypothetical protein
MFPPVNPATKPHDPQRLEGTPAALAPGEVPLAPPWQRRVLIAAGSYNIVWGTWVVLRPDDVFRWTGTPLPTLPELWQCIGMFVLVWGIGYLIAASDPWRHWPIVLVGMLGKIFGPIGFAMAVTSDQLPWSWGWTIVTNDLIWWVPFTMILIGAARAHLGPDVRLRTAVAQRRTVESFDPCDLPEAPDAVDVSDNSSRAALLARTRSTADGVPPPELLLVFMRHSGCVFCREALSTLAQWRERIEASGMQLVLVHLDEHHARFSSLAARHGLDGVELIADPERRLYRAFELRSAPIRAHFTWRQWLSGVRAWLGTAQFLGGPNGDVLQLPGIVHIAGGEVVRSVLADRSGTRIDVRPFLADGDA